MLRAPSGPTAIILFPRTSFEGRKDDDEAAGYSRSSDKVNTGCWHQAASTGPRRSRTSLHTVLRVTHGRRAITQCASRNGHFIRCDFQLRRGRTPEVPLLLCIRKRRKRAEGKGPATVKSTVPRSLHPHVGAHRGSRSHKTFHGFILMPGAHCGELLLVMRRTLQPASPQDVGRPREKSSAPEAYPATTKRHQRRCLGNGQWTCTEFQTVQPGSFSPCKLAHVQERGTSNYPFRNMASYVTCESSKTGLSPNNLSTAFHLCDRGATGSVLAADDGTESRMSSAVSEEITTTVAQLVRLLHKSHSEMPAPEGPLGVGALPRRPRSVHRTKYRKAGPSVLGGWCLHPNTVNLC